MAVTDQRKQEILSQAGFGVWEMLRMRSNLKAETTLFNLTDVIEKDPNIPNPTQEQFVLALAQKWKQDPQVFAKLEAELKADPTLGQKLIDGVKSNPAATLNALNQYNGSNLSTVMANAAAAPAAQPQNAPPSPSPAGSTTTATPNGSSTSTPSPAAAAAGAAQPRTEEDDLNDIIASSDQDIKDGLNADAVKMLADKMAKVASGTFGVSTVATDAFKKKIDDPKSTVNGKPLADAIAQNLQNNPEFVRQMAMMAKDKKPMEEPIKSKAQQEMTKLMANPELLADDKYVKEKQQQFEMAQKIKEMGIAGMLKQFMEESMGPLKSGFANMGYMMAGFSGAHSVISMSSGGGFMPTLMINLDAFQANKDAAMAIGRYSPLEMTAFAPKGADGKFFHEVVKKDADGKEMKGPDGKPVTEKVPNGQITIKTADGKEKKVIPAVGTLVAQQEAGSFDAKGQYMPGNFRVPVVPSITEHGVSNGLQIAVMTPAEFEKYKQQADAAARERGGSIKELQVETYTAADATRAGQGPGVQVHQVNPQNGTVSAPVTVVAAAPSISMDPNLLNPNRNAANDRDFRLQG